MHSLDDLLASYFATCNIGGHAPNCSIKSIRKLQGQEARFISEIYNQIVSHGRPTVERIACNVFQTFREIPYEVPLNRSSIVRNGLSDILSSGKKMCVDEVPAIVKLLRVLMTICGNNASVRYGLVGKFDGMEGPHYVALVYGQRKQIIIDPTLNVFGPKDEVEFRYEGLTPLSDEQMKHHTRMNAKIPPLFTVLTRHIIHASRKNRTHIVCVEITGTFELGNDRLVNQQIRNCAQGGDIILCSILDGQRSFQIYDLNGRLKKHFGNLTHCNPYDSRKIPLTLREQLDSGELKKRVEILEKIQNHPEPWERIRGVLDGLDQLQEVLS